VSNEALCILTGLTPIAIKIGEAAQFFQLTRGSTNKGVQIDRDMEVKHWRHPAETLTNLAEDKEETNSIQIFIDGSKTKKGVGSGIAIFESGQHTKSLKCKLNKNAQTTKSKN